MRSQKEIDAELKRLTELKDQVPQYTMFGDDNRAAIEAQIEVLSEELDLDDIYQRSVEDEDDDDDSKWNLHTRDSALTAFQWLSEEEDELPSKGWSEIVESRMKGKKK